MLPIVQIQETFNNNSTLNRKLIDAACKVVLHYIM